MNKAKQELKEKIITAIKEYENHTNVQLLSKIQSIDFFIWADANENVAERSTLQINYKQNGMRI
jgi:ABC-type phosphate/phosphonate transport system substrate-binding protein